MSRNPAVVSLLPAEEAPASLVTAWNRAVMQISPFATPGCITSRANGQTTCTDPDFWASRIPVSPELACNILTRGLPAETEVTCRFYPLRGHAVEIGIRGPGYVDSRDFLLTSRMISSGGISIAENGQKQNVGRRMIRNQIELGFVSGMRKMHILAGSSNGGYTWARFGFTPRSMEEATRNILAQYENISHLLTRDEEMRIAEHLPLHHKSDIWALADLRDDLAPRLRDAFSRSERPREISDFMTPPTLADRFGGIVAQGGAVPLGAVLLVGSYWDGHMDFHDPVQMKRAGDYSGGWKYISINGGPA